jgi:hypothetical protein
LIRATLLVVEAHRLEKLHLQHQYQYFTKLVKDPKGTKLPCNACACLKASCSKQLTPKYRAMNLLREYFEDKKLENAVEALRRTYASDNSMMDHLVFQYGVEPQEAPPEYLLASVRQRLKGVDTKWKNILEDVKLEMKHGDNFPTVIRNLSIMRIFLEGSQASTYSCDMSERARRDAVHQRVLDELAEERSLFVKQKK